MNTSYIAVQIDEENGNDAWWTALEERFPGFARSLRRNRVAVISAHLWDQLASIPGFEDGPDSAPTPLLDCGGEGDQWADVCAQRHAVFEELD